MPAAPSGHLFYHDMNAHSLFNWIPPKYLELVKAQNQYMLQFSDWLAENHPELSNLKINVEAINEGDSEMPLRQFPFMTGVARQTFTEVDFGTANIGLRMNRKSLLSTVEQGEHSFLLC